MFSVFQVIVCHKHQYDITWCIFDKDDFSLRKACSLVKKKNIYVDYSNKSFELWYLLHFEYRSNAISNEQYKAKLSKYLREEYNKTSTKMYDLLKDKQQYAICNAKKLFEYYNKKDPDKNDPSTIVFELVEKLNQYIK